MVKDRLPSLMKEHAVDLVLANGENAAAGFGITPQLAEDFFDMGIDVLTTGNHVWDKREIVDFLTPRMEIRTAPPVECCAPQTIRRDAGMGRL